MARVAPQREIEAALGHDPQVLEGCYKVAVAVVDAAKARAPKGEGGARYAYGIGPVGVMAAAIRADHTTFGARARSPVDWSVFNEVGTGVHGPKRARVRAKVGKPMVFYAKQHSDGQVRKFVVTSHAGMEANHFMSRAAEEVAASSDRLTWHPHGLKPSAP